MLLAVSGGRDSVTLFDLMCRAGYDVGVAHCNFHLRPGDSDRDEAFVRRLAAERSLPCHVAQFDTLAYASAHGLSVEEAARDLRYAFFEQLRVQEGYDLVATAHHRDDAIETFFINLLRGTGIGGLHGILPRNNHVVRPLLPYGRDDIDAYVSEQRLPYVDDSTNMQPLFLRNRIRLQLIPLLRDISPSFDDVMQSNMRHLTDAGTVYRKAVERIRDEVLGGDGDSFAIDIARLRKYEPLDTLLFELLRPFGFNGSVASQVAASLDAQSGKRFLSPSHTLLKDRDRLLVTPSNSHLRLLSQEQDCQEHGRNDFFLIYEDTDLSALPIPLAMEVRSYDGTVPRLSRNEAWFDRSQLTYPLVLRHWRNGDRFRPYGMSGTRLVSDLFIDLKLSLDAKADAWLLVDGDGDAADSCADRGNGTILWVVGLRAAHHAVVTPATTEVVAFRCAVR